MTTRNTGDLELTLCNNSDCSEQTSSSRTSSDYDMGIHKRLQYLTQRVEDLERKLEKGLPTETGDLSFGLSIDNNNSVPNVDIKVLSGSRKPYNKSTAEDLMSGWDDSIVERNTSFLIIPVGDDKDLQLNEVQRIKQTLHGTLEPTISLPALCCAETYDRIIDADEVEECVQENKIQPSLYTTHRAISLSVYPFGNDSNEGNNVLSETLLSKSESSSFKINECLINDMNLKISGSDEKKLNNEKEMEKLSDQQEMEKVTTNTERLNSLSTSRNPHSDVQLKYGYTISITGISSQKNDERHKTLPIQSRLSEYESNSLGHDKEGIVPEKRGSENKTFPQNLASMNENKLNSTIVRSTVLQRIKNCDEDFGIQEDYEKNNNEHDANTDDVCNDRPIRIEPCLSKHDVLHQNPGNSHTYDAHSVKGQLMNAGRMINEANVTAIESELLNRSLEENACSFDDSSLEKEVEEITSRVYRPIFTQSDKEDERIIMQKEPIRFQRSKNSYCFGNGSDYACMRSNNTTDDNGLVNNNVNHNAVDCSDMIDLKNTTIYKNTRNRCANNTTTLKGRVRSTELPLTSSEEDLSSMMVSGGTNRWSNPRTNRPQHKKQRNKTSKSSFSTRNITRYPEPAQNIEKTLKDLIDPGEIGNLHEEIAAVNRPLLLAVMSPTDSGYIGSNADSPRDAWKDNHEYEKSIPAKSHLPTQPCCRSSSLYFSTSVVTTPAMIQRVPNVWSAHAEKKEVHPLPTRLRKSRGSHSSTSSTVSYIGGSDYSEISCSEDNDAYSELTISPLQLDNETTSSLSEYFPGPSRLPFDNYSSTVRLNEYLLNRHPIASPTSSVGTNDLSDSIFGCEGNYCECQTGIATEKDFREELKSISRHVLDVRAKTRLVRRERKSLKKYFLDEEQGEMDIFGAKLQKDDHKAVPILVKVILRLRKHFFGGIDGPNSLKSLSPRQEKKFVESGTRERKISFSPSAMLLSAVGESSASEIRDVIEKDRLDVNQLRPSGKSLLHKVAASGDLESIHTLIQYGAEVNLTDQDGFSPVHSALRRCHYKCAIFLIECGTDMGAYTRARVRELSIINSMSCECMKSVLNTPL